MRCGVVLPAWILRMFDCLAAYVSLTPEARRQLSVDARVHYLVRFARPGRLPASKPYEKQSNWPHKIY